MEDRMAALALFSSSIYCLNHFWNVCFIMLSAVELWLCSDYIKQASVSRAFGQ